MKDLSHRIEEITSESGGKQAKIKSFFFSMYVYVGHHEKVWPIPVQVTWSVAKLRIIINVDVSVSFC